MVGIWPDPPATLKTVVPMNVRFCRVLDIPLNVLQVLKLFA